MVIGDSIVRHVRATLAEGKVHTHCLPGARVLDVSVQIPAILKDDESVAAVVIHAGANDTKLRQSETLKRDFRSLIETVRSTSPAATIIVSGPLPTYRRGHERFSRPFALRFKVKVQGQGFFICHIIVIQGITRSEMQSNQVRSVDSAKQ